MIYEILPTGKENAVRKRELLNRLNISERKFRLILHSERAAGHVICSKTGERGGYYIPKDKAEAKEYICSMESRGKNVFVAIQSARNFVTQTDGQETLFPEDPNLGK